MPVDTPVDYADAPPAFGAHWNQQGVAPASFSRKFYTADDRPALEALVHNLEHGYTILWYDDTIAKDPAALDDVEAIARKFGGSDDLRDKFIAAPWTSDDENGAKLPDGKHVAFTHWSAGGDGETDTKKQVGVFQYCSGVSGAALSDFMDEVPLHRLARACAPCEMRAPHPSSLGCGALTATSARRGRTPSARRRPA